MTTMTINLFILPTTVSNLEAIQEGIEFYTDPNEATAAAAVINAGDPSYNVFTYAQQLLENNLSLSQVAMGVDSLMFGQTDTIAELTNLSTQFLPAQVAYAQANGFNPTVYAAEALGLSLAGGNGTSEAFATSYGELSVLNFQNEIASITGINPVAIEGWVNNWEAFYSTHPNAIPATVITEATIVGVPAAQLAAYGATFGDAVGASLVDVPIGLISTEVVNALADNIQGSYTAGVPIGKLPTALPYTQPVDIVGTALHSAIEG